MEVTFGVSGGRETDGPGSLREWMQADGELGGRARVVHAPVEEGTLGSLADVLAVTLGPGGVATAVASAAIAWIRRRVGDVTVKVTRPDGASLSLSSQNVRGVDETAVRALIAQTAAWLDGPALASGNAGVTAVGGESADAG